MNYINIFIIIIICIIIIYSVNIETFNNTLNNNTLNNNTLNNNTLNNNTLNNNTLNNNTLTYEMVFEQLNMQQYKKYSKTPKLFFENIEERSKSYNDHLENSIQSKFISENESSILTFKLLDGILLVDTTLQYYLVVSRGLLQIYQIFIENDQVEIIRKITFNPQSNITWNYHYYDFLHNHIDLIKSHDWRFQNDGNLVLYDYFGNLFWQSGTSGDKFALTIDKFNLVLTNINNKKDNKIINIDRIDSLKIPIIDNYNNIMESDYIFEYFINKINKIYKFQDLDIIIVLEPLQNARYKQIKKPPIF